MSTIIPPSLDYLVTNYVAPTTDTAFDGTLTVQFDSTNISSNYNIYYSQQNSTPDTSWVNPTDLKIDSLTNGYVQLFIENPLDSSDFSYFRIYVGDPSDIYVDTGLYISTSFQHADTNCTGWISVVAPSPQGNVLNVWNDQVSNTTYRDNLCPGLYSVYSYDVQGATFYGASIDTVVITNNNTAYIDSSIYTTPINDTSYINFSNCLFDYNAPIDSLHYIEDTLYDNGGILIVEFVMTMFQGNNFVSVTDSLVTVNGTTIMLDVVLYCDQFKSTFKGQRIVYLRGASEHNFYQNGNLSIDEKEIDYKFYPNPTSGLVYLESTDGSVPKKITVIDSKGAVLIEQQTLELNTFDLSTFEQGIYFVKVETGENRIVQRVIKN